MGDALGWLIVLVPLVITLATGVLLTPFLVRHGATLRRHPIAGGLLAVPLILVIASFIVVSTVSDPEQNCDPVEDAARTLLIVCFGSSLIGGLAVGVTLATSKNLDRPAGVAIMSLVGTYVIGGVALFAGLCTYT